MTRSVFEEFQTKIDNRGLKPLDYLFSVEQYLRLCAVFVLRNLRALSGTAAQS